MYSWSLGHDLDTTAASTLIDAKEKYVVNLDMSNRMRWDCMLPGVQHDFLSSASGNLSSKKPSNVKARTWWMAIDTSRKNAFCFYCWAPPQQKWCFCSDFFYPFFPWEGWMFPTSLRWELLVYRDWSISWMAPTTPWKWVGPMIHPSWFRLAISPWPFPTRFPELPWARGGFQWDLESGCFLLATPGALDLNF